MALNQVSMVPAGVLRVISDGFWSPISAFSEGSPTIFRKQMPCGIGTESLGMIGFIFAENGPLECGIQVSMVPAGVLRVISYVILTYTSTFSNIEPIFSKAHALSYTHSKVGNDQMHIRGEITSGK